MGEYGSGGSMGVWEYGNSKPDYFYAHTPILPHSHIQGLTRPIRVPQLAWGPRVPPHVASTL